MNQNDKSICGLQNQKKTLKKNTIHLQMEQCIRSSSNSVVLGKTRGAGLLFFLFIIDIDWLNRRNPTYQVPSGNRTSTIWLFNIAMENSTIFKFGKPSISIRAVEKPWRTVSHNQRVCHQILQIPG